MILLLLAAALAGDKPWLDENGDVTAQMMFSAPADTIYDEISDLRFFERHGPERCFSDFVPGSTTRGMGGSATLTYHAGPMHRPLEGFIIAADPGRRIDIDHPGRKGFITRFALEELGGNTKVTVTTYINPPPWPLKKPYFTRVRPAWAQCYLDLLDALDKATGD